MSSLDDDAAFIAAVRVARAHDLTLTYSEAVAAAAILLRNPGSAVDVAVTAVWVAQEIAAERLFADNWLLRLETRGDVAYVDVGRMVRGELPSHERLATSGQYGPCGCLRCRGERVVT